MKSLDINIKKLGDLIPDYVFNVSDTLIESGFDAYLVGGSVRDIFLSKSPDDYDIATNATPDQVQKIFPKSIATGARFGTILVVISDEYGESYDVEVTTYRSESDYIGGRWPSNIEFSDNIEKDLERRDFTINAFALNLDNFNEDEYIEDKVIDLFGGIDDLKNKKIKAVGDPLERFKEDGLRPIRACRFASVLDFDIEKETFEAIPKSLNVVDQVAIERVRDELDKMIKRSKKPSKGFRLMESSGILSLFIPELVKAKEFYQPRYHADNVFEHSLKTMDIAEDDIKWAALLHDIGKIKTKTEDEEGVHFYGHDVIGSNMARKILKRLRFSKNDIKAISNLIRWHMFYYPSSDWRKENSLRDIEKEEVDKNKHGWSDGAVRRFIAKVGGEEQIDKLIKLRIADATSNPKSLFDSKEIRALQERIAEVRKEDMALKVEDLDFSGNDLKEMGLEPGPIYQKILNFLLNKVIDDPSLNKHSILKAIVKENFEV